MVERTPIFWMEEHEKLGCVELPMQAVLLRLKEVKEGTLKLTPIASYLSEPKKKPSTLPINSMSMITQA